MVSMNESDRQSARTDFIKVCNPNGWQGYVNPKASQEIYLTTVKKFFEQENGGRKYCPLRDDEKILAMYVTKDERFGIVSMNAQEAISKLEGFGLYLHDLKNG